MTKDDLVQEMKTEIPKHVHRWSPMIPFVKSYLRTAYSIIMEKLTLTPEEKAAQKIQQDVLMKLIDALPNILTDEKFIEAAAEFAGNVEVLSRAQLAVQSKDDLPN